jgi:uncharacterized protein (DUF302 family)
MQSTKYAFRIELDAPYEKAIEDVAGALKEQGFGVLTTIDVKETLKQKLDKEFRRYVILGACNPVLAHEALATELEIGVLLPCNVIVYETSAHSSVVAAMAPLSALGMLGAEKLDPVAKEADKRIRRALESLERSRN